MASKVMPPDETANYAFQHKIILTYANRNEVVVEPWTPGQKLPMNFKRSIHKYGPDLAQKMREGDVRLCPTALHEDYHSNNVCLMCVQLDNSILSQERRETA